jgi:hypothetical protein
MCASSRVGHQVTHLVGVALKRGLRREEVVTHEAAPTVVVVAGMGPGFCLSVRVSPAATRGEFVDI